MAITLPDATPITIEPCSTPSLFLKIADVRRAVFGVTPLMKHLFQQDPASVATEADAATGDEYPYQRTVVALLPDQTVIGYGKWDEYLEPPIPFQEDTMGKAGNDPELYKIFPAPYNTDGDGTSNPALFNHFIACLARMREPHVAGRLFFHVTVLGVHPNYQRLGIGKAMLEHILERADQKGTDCYIEASPEGLGLYRKMGWEVIGQVIIDLESWGGRKGVRITRTGMLRKPKKLCLAGRTSK
ncbi:MAG: hypothetical protein M1834_009406 [Cirrosporium novae-zelandiae]|nr:MAG: hypothetical protein M1834_009406 [Cirrosporium novae-zelandiae]